MSKYFLGSVGRCEAFYVSETNEYGEAHMQTAFTCNSLTSSAISVNVQKEDIIDSSNGVVAGELVHSPNVTVNLTDILWDSTYLELQLGSHFSKVGELTNDKMYQHSFTANENGTINITQSPFPRPLSFGNLSDLLIGYIQTEDNNWKVVEITKNGGGTSYSIDGNDILPNKTYCVRYYIQTFNTRELTLTTNIIPEELFLRISTPIFFVDGGDTSDGSLAGEIVYEIPRWCVDVESSLNNSASGSQDFSLTGTVLEEITNDEDAVLMKVKEIIFSRQWYEGLQYIVADDGSIECEDISQEGEDFYRYKIKLNNVMGFYSEKSSSLSSDAYNSTDIKWCITNIDFTEGKSYICEVYDDPEEYNIWTRNGKSWNVGGGIIVEFFPPETEEEPFPTVRVTVAVACCDIEGNEGVTVLNNMNNTFEYSISRKE